MAKTGEVVRNALLTLRDDIIEHCALMVEQLPAEEVAPEAGWDHTQRDKAARLALANAAARIRALK